MAELGAGVTLFEEGEEEECTASNSTPPAGMRASSRLEVCVCVCGGRGGGGEEGMYVT